MSGSLAATMAGLRRELAADALDLPDIFAIGQQIADLAEDHPGAEGGVPVQRIGVIGSLTTDYLVRAIACAVVQEGVLPVVYQAPFGAYVQEVLDRKSGLHRFRPDLVVIAPDWRDIATGLPIDSPPAAVDELVAAKVDGFVRLWEVIAGELRARIVQHLLVPPAHHFRGIAERLSPASPENQVAALTRALLTAGRGRVAWVETDRLAARLGLSQFADAGGYAVARLPFSLRFLPDYLPGFRAAWRAANARIKKVLVLDLDNTLWGGVIGDDGVDDIVIGPGSPAGEAFVDWGGYLKQLAARGVILAVCSKNDPEIAASAFTHPHMVLRRSDFAAFRCSWEDKASQLQAIAGDLDLGIDSLVLADDNPAECEQVRQALPDVGVVHLGADPARFIDRLDRFQWFDLPHYTEEDLRRGAAYAARAEARAEAAAAADIPAFLSGLRMVGQLNRAEPSELPRLAQMELKTNQFNLTTRRYGEDAIRSLMRREDAVVLSFRLADKFGDHGLVSLLIAVHEEDRLRIDSWLMSCRVFSRTAEEFIMGRLIEIARMRQASHIIGEYRPTTKNGVVSDLFARLGFSQMSPGSPFWQLGIAGDIVMRGPAHFITAKPADTSEAAE